MSNRVAPVHTNLVLSGGRAQVEALARAAHLELGLSLDHLAGLGGTVHDDWSRMVGDPVSKTVGVVRVQIRRRQYANVEVGVVGVLPKVKVDISFVLHHLAVNAMRSVHIDPMLKVVEQGQDGTALSTPERRLQIPRVGAHHPVVAPLLVCHLEKAPTLVVRDLDLRFGVAIVWVPAKPSIPRGGFWSAKPQNVSGIKRMLHPDQITGDVGQHDIFFEAHITVHEVEEIGGLDLWSQCVQNVLKLG
mmetsp:Transcript_6635/g.17075  ORF Transcript_6635/g.17075 Transcript_6635/m.17075 type:complete len:246 (+) Transcript_6635:686-1423(+)